MKRRLLRLMLAVLPIAGLFAAASPAQADPFFPDPATSVVVTRLTVTAGKGWLVLQPRIGHDTAIGFEVTIPAGDGAWSGPARIPVLELGISCVRRAGPDLDYLCGSDDAWSDPLAPLLPSGGYQITIPVTRTGPISGLTGATKYWEINPYEGAAAYPSDTFPVVDPSHFLSTAEVRNFYTDVRMPYNKIDGGDIAVTMTAVPGEQVHSVDITLPPAPWLLGGWTGGPRVQCRQVNGPSSTLIHCAPILSYNNFLTGRYPFVVALLLPQAADEPTSQPATVALGIGGAAPVVQDTFRWNKVIHY